MTGGDPRSILDALIGKAKRQGADAADALLVESASLSHAERLGKPEHLERAESRDVGLRVIIGRKQAVVSSNDWARDTLDALVDRAVAMARVVPDDAYCGLADPEALFKGVPADLDSVDSIEPAPETLIERARIAEEAARAVPGVTNSEGAEGQWSRSSVTLLASNGFEGAYSRTSHAVSVSVIAGEGTAMERDYDFTSAVHAEDLDDPAAVGRSAGERAVKRLHARRGPTTKAPVVFDPRVSGGLVGHLAGAINGAAITRGTSFLKDRMGAQVFARGITIVDDPHRRRGLRSKPFDAEGLPNDRLALVADGVLQCWILDLRTARQLGMESNGRAARGASSPPSPATTNLYMEAGTKAPEALIADIDQGFYVTELMGFGINGVTGDYSRGAAGFWIEKGTIAYPVSGMTIASNLKDMFLTLEPANDLAFRYGTNAPTIRVEGMTIAGT